MHPHRHEAQYRGRAHAVSPGLATQSHMDSGAARDRKTKAHRLPDRVPARRVPDRQG
jgi:hypothetical protein